MPMMASGTNFKTVVTSCTCALSRTPIALTAVSSQITPIPTSAASRLCVPSAGQKTAK